MYKLGKQSMKNLVGVHPLIAFAVYKAIERTKQDFTVFEGVRTTARQKHLFDEGVSKTLDSYHLYGLAVDLVAIVNGKPTWEEKYYGEIHKAVTEVCKTYQIRLENGFDLWGFDMPHWQLTGWKDQYDIRKLN